MKNVKGQTVILKKCERELANVCENIEAYLRSHGDLRILQEGAKRQQG